MPAPFTFHRLTFHRQPWPSWGSFLWVLVGGLALLLICGLTPSSLTQTAFAQDAAEPPRRLHQLSDAQWQSLLRQTRQALAPPADNHPTSSGSSSESETLVAENEELQSLSSVPILKRDSAFRDAVLRWCQSKDFATSQTDSWIQAHFAPTSVAPSLPHSVAPWNDSLHTDWLQSSIVANEPFFKFLHQQLAADLDENDVLAALPTASWFRGRSWESIPLFRPHPETQSTRPSAEWYERTTDAQRNQRSDLDRAIASILKTESQDWQRLLVAKTVAQWHAQRAEPPLPPETDLIAQWPNELPITSSEEAVIGDQMPWTDALGREVVASPMEIGAGLSASVPVSSPLSLSREWSLVWNLNVEVDVAGALDSTPSMLLFSQRPIDDSPEKQGLPQGITVAWHQQHLRCSLVHDDSISSIEVESLLALPLRDRHQLAVVYDGTRAASGLRIACDGQFLETRVLADRIARDISSPSPTLWQLGDPSTHGLPRGLPNGLIASIEDFQCYRIALTEPELGALTQSVEWKPWTECSDRQRLGWVEYFARRVDLEWRYQRESLLYYLSNLARMASTIPIVPVMDGTVSMDGWRMNPARFPGSLLSAVDVRIHADGVPWLGARDRGEFVTRLLNNESRRAEIAAAEVHRQWLALTRTIPGEQSHPATPEPNILRQWTDGFIDSDGDRRQLLLQLVSSPNWLAIALDLKR
jgi:hypothetical protein